MSNLALVLLGPAILGLVVVVYLMLLRTRLHYTSRLTCPRCKRPFDYQWVPLVSFSAIRLGHARYLECPLCHEWSTFNIWATKVADSEKRQ